jgi:hypothetical protein
MSDRTGVPTMEALRSNFTAQCEAMVLGDVDELGALLTDDFTLLHMTGYLQPRAEWLHDITTQRMQYHHIDVVALRATAKGPDLMLTARTITEATIWGSHGTWRLQLQQTFRKQDDDWLASRSVASTW